MTCVLPLVLLVEDDPDTATLYRALLGSEGMEVVHCADCGEAHRWWSASLRRPDLVVVDVRLPDGNGLELCQAMAEPGGHMPPIMVLSAHGDPRMPSLCAKAGVAAFLDKLSGMDCFVNTARQLLHC
ncbi:MAG: response regulator [Desulfarculus sp.]|nr:response regulator [Desulfarculus sp.]